MGCATIGHCVSMQFMSRSSILHGPRAKLARAREHLDALSVEVVRWRQESAAKGDVVEIALQPAPKPGRPHAHVGIVRSVPTPPPRFGLIIGDIVHNLRGALDHVAWYLADRYSPNRGEDTSTQFPIVTSRRRFERPPTQQMLRYLSPADIDIKEKLQPYHTADPPEDGALAYLQLLSNRDKHRTINTVVAAPEFLIMTFTPVRDCEVKNFASISAGLEVGAEAIWLDIVPTGPNPQLEVAPHFTATIAISEGGRSGIAQYVLPNLYRAVLTVIRYFERVLRRRS